MTLVLSAERERMKNPSLRDVVEARSHAAAPGWKASDAEKDLKAVQKALENGDGPIVWAEISHTGMFVGVATEPFQFQVDADGRCAWMSSPNLTIGSDFAGNRQNSPWSRGDGKYFIPAKWTIRDAAKVDQVFGRRPSSATGALIFGEEALYELFDRMIQFELRPLSATEAEAREAYMNAPREIRGRDYDRFREAWKAVERHPVPFRHSIGALGLGMLQAAGVDWSERAGKRISRSSRKLLHEGALKETSELLASLITATGDGIFYVHELGQRLVGSPLDEADRDRVVARVEAMFRDDSIAPRDNAHHRSHARIERLQCLSEFTRATGGSMDAYIQAVTDNFFNNVIGVGKSRVPEVARETLE